VAAIYSLLHMMARPQDRAVMDQEIDLKLVNMMMSDVSNHYRRTRPTRYKQDSHDESDLTQDRRATAPQNPYRAGKHDASDQ